METNRTLKVQKTDNVLLANQHYFNYVFKKTEKIICVVFYIVQNHKDIEGHKIQTVRDIQNAAKNVLDVILTTLSLEHHEAKPQLVQAAALFVTLQSYLAVGQSIGIFNEDVVQVLNSEIDGVMRSMNKYLENENISLDFTSVDLVNKKKQQNKFTTPHLGAADRSQRTTTTTQRSTATASTRRDQIITIIMDKKTVSIKDLSIEIKDCSEKTIQRELNTMIQNGVIRREGQRRWSTYSLL